MPRNHSSSAFGLCLAFYLAVLGLWTPTAAAEAGSGVAADRTDSPSFPTITWQPHTFESAQGDVVAAELGTLSVPENREADATRSIELSFVRFPSTAKEPGAPIVYLAGGPGGSGIGTARGRRFPLFMALRAHADVIAFDQRGTGLSNHIPHCPFSEPVPLDQPLEPAWVGRFVEREARRCAEVWRRAGVDLEGYDSAQSADDLEDLRRALGADHLTLWGISYGTHLAFAALARHSGSFDRLILASAEGPDETVKSPRRTQAFLEHVDAMARAADPSSPGLVGPLGAVLDRLAEAPITVTTAHPVTGEPVAITLGRLDVQLITGFMIKNPDTIARLVPLVQAMAAGDFSHLAPIALRVRLGFDGLRGMPEAMDAASGMSPARRTQVLRERGNSLLGDVLNFPVLSDWDLAGWLGIDELPASFRHAPSADIPVLFLSGTLDGRTYVETHRELAAGFPHSTFLLLEDAGHDLLMASPEVERRILEFLATGTTSEEPIALPSPFGG